MTDPAQPPPSGAPTPGDADWDALARLAAGEPATDPDAEARDGSARAWLGAHPAEAARMDLLNQALRGEAVSRTRLAAAAPAVDVEAALARVRATAGLDRAAAPPAPQLTVVRGGAPRPSPRAAHRSAPGRRRVGALLAASVALAAGVTLWRTREPDGSAGTAVAERAAQHHATGVGERQVLHLADGSQVTLGPASTLDVPVDFVSGPARRVRLTGEAYFRAVHDARRPFEVAAGGAVVRDIGTAFVVRAPAATRGAAGRAVDVAVTDGAVRLEAAPAAQTGAGRAADSPASGVLLRAGDRGRVLDDAGAAAPRVAVVARGTDVGADTAWTTGRLVFRDTPLTAVAGELRRWYGVELRFADSAVAARHLTATFAGESTDAVLRVVGLATGARLERRGDTVVVREATPSH